MSKSNSYRKIFLILLVGLHAIGFIKQTLDAGLLTLDSDDYILLAENLRDFQLPYSGEIAEKANLKQLPNQGLFASRPILYSIFIWFTGGLGLSLFLTLLIQNLLSIFSILCIEKLFRQYDFKINYLIASLGLLFFPSLWIYANWIMAETLFMFCLTLSIFFLLKRKPSFILSALFLGITLFVKPVVVFLIYLWLIGFIVFTIRSKSKKYLLIAFIPFLFLILQVGINFKYTHTAIVSSMPGINLVQYNAYFTLSKTKGATEAGKWVDTIDKQGALIESKSGFKEAYHFKKGEALSVLKSNILTYFWIHAQGSARWFVDPGRFDILNFFDLYFEDGNQGWTRTFYQEGVAGLWQRVKEENFLLLLLILFIFLWNIFRFFLLIRNAKILFNHQKLALIFSLLILYFSAISGPVSTARFLLPLFPIILFWSSLKKVKKQYERINGAKSTLQHLAKTVI